MPTNRDIITNDDRAGNGRDTVCLYSELLEGEPQTQEHLIGIISEGNLYDDPETVLIDLLADLMHWAVKDGVDFASALETAAEHFQFEVKEEEEQK